MLRRVIGTDVVLQTALDPGLRPVKADTGQVEQVILNLAINARDAMPLGGTLMIATRNASPATGPAEGRSRPTVLLEVSDTGTGMTDDVKRHAFEPFFTTKDVGKGTGLGLATIQAIVRQAGGSIEVDTEPGYGTTFRIYLPATSEPVTPKSDPGPTRAPRGTETVLLVEDDDGVRSLAATILRGCGYTVVEARHGDEALAVADRHDGPFGLLVTDVVMPGLGGRELADRLADRWPQLRVLFLSGYGVDAAGVPGAKLLQKPFTAAELARRVRKVLDAPAGG
jgi:CheY-like chemotaxis protein